MFAVLLMAGGKGERFWPLSREMKPKQLLPITSRRTMIEETLARVCPPVSAEKVFISAGKNIAGPMRELFPEIPEENFVFEPVGRNTAPCIGLAMLKIRKKLGDLPVAVLPADHLIKPKEALLNALQVAADIAHHSGRIITIGISPTVAHTGYGYIQHGSTLEDRGEISLYELTRFTEKPDIVTAETFLESGNYLWNSGMFVWRTDIILQELGEHLPQLREILDEIEPFIGTEDEWRTITQWFPKAPSISIDYAVMEKTRRGAVMRATFSWDDVGSWAALERIHQPDEEGNVRLGLTEVLDSKDCILLSSGPRIAALGVQELIIVATDDAVLVCPKERSEDVKKIVQQMPKESR